MINLTKQTKGEQMKKVLLAGLVTLGLLGCGPDKSTEATIVAKDGKNGKTETYQQSEALYHLEKDISESANVIIDYPEIANELRQALKSFDQTIKREARPVGVTTK